MTRLPIIPLLEHLGFDPHELGPTPPGRWIKIKCAIHGERNASASYMAYEDDQCFNCKACNASGDSISLAQKQLNLSYGEAVELLAHLAGVSPEGLVQKKPERYRPVRLGETPPPRNTAPAQKKSRRRKRARL